MDPIRYQFDCDDGRSFHYMVDRDHEQDTPAQHGNVTLPEWTKLDFERCEGCEWQLTDRCPVAVDMIEPVQLLNHLPSHEKISVVVDTENRQYRKRCDVQEGLSSLFGLIMARSGCPAFRLFHGLTDFHLPFASFEETLFRNTAVHLIHDYFHQHHYTETSLIHAVQQTYDVIRKVNYGFAKRLRRGCFLKTDSASNALVILDAMGSLVSLSVKDEMEYLRTRFA